MCHPCNTAALQGTKVAKAGELAKLWKYRAKQKKKVRALEQLEAATTAGQGAAVLHDGALEPPTRLRVESVEMEPMK